MTEDKVKEIIRNLPKNKFSFDDLRKNFSGMLSSSAATSTGQSIDWQLWNNRDDTTFDASAISQAAASPTSSTLNASNEVVTLTIDATGEAAIAAGDVITVDIWNAGTSDATTEIKGIQARYTATQ